MSSFDFIVDVESKRLVKSFKSGRNTRPGIAVFGDAPDISVRFVERNEGNTSLPWRDIDVSSGYSARVAIGTPGGDPESGTFTLTHDGNETGELDIASATLAADIETELEGLASISAVTVSAVSAGFQIDWDTVGAQTAITATTTRLFPSSSATIYESITGDATTKESQVLVFETDSASYVELTTAIADPAATITTVRAGAVGVSEIQRVVISGEPYAGTYQLTIDGETSGAISPNATTDAIEAAIEAITGIGTGNVTVTGASLDYTVEFAASLENVSPIVATTTNLTGANGFAGTIDFNTNEFLELLGGASSASATLEIVLYDTGNNTSDTVLQEAITCRQDVIPDTPPSATGLPTYAAASHTHLVADITDLAISDVMLTTDTDLTGHGFFIDDDTLAADDNTKVASQSSIKNYVDTQITGLGSVMEFKGSYDASTDPADEAVGASRVVTVGGTGVASFWSSALEIGDLVIQEVTPATTEADYVVVSRDVIPATETVAGVVELATQAEVDTGTDTDRAVTPATLSNYSGLPTGTPEGTAVLSTGETAGKLLQADGDDSCSWVAAPSGTPEGTAVLSTGETVGKLLQADGDDSCSWVAAPDADALSTTGASVNVAAAAPPSTGQVLKATSATTATWQDETAGGISSVAADTTPQLGGDLDTNGNAIITVSNADLELSPNGTGEIIQTAYSATQRNGNFSTAGDAQAVNYVLRCQTTSTTPVTFTLDGSSAEMTLSADSTWAFKGLVVARQGTTQNCAGYEFNGLIEYEESSGASNLLASTVDTPIHEDDAGWNITIAANGTGLRLQAIGNTGDNVNWVAYVTTVQTTNATTYY